MNDSALALAFRNAVLNITSKDGQPATLGTAGGTVFYNDGTNDHLDRVWIRMGAEKQIQVVAKVGKSGLPSVPGLEVRASKRHGSIYVDDWVAPPIEATSGGTTTGIGLSGHTHDYATRNVRTSEYAGTPAGSDNVVMGYAAGDALGASSAENVIIGASAGASAANDTDSVVIGYNAGNYSGAAASFDSFDTAAEITDDYPTNEPTFNVYGTESSIYRVAELTSDLYIYCYYEVGSPYQQYVRAFVPSTGSFGAQVGVGDTGDIGDIAFVELSSTQFFIIYSQYDTDGYYLFCRSASVSGTTITLGTETALSIDLSSGAGFWDVHAAKIDSTHAFITYGNSLAKGSGGYSEGRIVTISGGTSTPATADQFTTDQVTTTQTVVLSSSVIVTIWNELVSSTEREVKACIGDISGTSVTYRATESTLVSDSSDTPKHLHSVTIDSTSFLLAYARMTGTDDGYVAVCSISGDNVNIGTSQNFSTVTVYSYHGPQVGLINSSTAYVAYTYGLDWQLRLLTLSGTSITVGDANTFTNANNNYAPLPRTIDSSSILAVMITDDDATGDWYVEYTIANLTGGGGTRTNNVFIGAGAGGGADVSNSVCIGQAAGSQETNSYRLYIDITNTTAPLIYGEFDDDNIGINGVDMAGGEGVIFIANATTAPASTPTGGGVLYVEGGALKYKGSSGTVTTLGVA